MSKLVTAFVLSALAAALAGCGGSGGSSSASSVGSASPSTRAAGAGVKIATANIAGLGPVLVDAQGRTLYVFAPDKHAKVTCLGTCAKVWPPVSLPAGQQPLASGAVQRSMLGSDPDPAGGKVATYAHWPLYTYVADTRSGTATGQALNLNGGLWYVIAPSGKVITKKP